MSIAGGLHRAIESAAALRCTALQIFSRNSNQWSMKPLIPDAVAKWKETLVRHPMATMVHDSYLINLASPDGALYRRSRSAFLEEARRCVQLGIPYLVFHPGAHMGKGEPNGLDRIVRALDWVDERLGSGPVTLLIENTAGQGTSLGYRFEHLAHIRSAARRPQRLGICLDTCHLLAAGYDFRTDSGYERVFDELERVVGTGAVRAFHLNDSKKGLGSRVDRHEHVGKGFVGSRAFRLLLQDPRFRGLPMVLETPKAGEMDRRNLALLRRLASLGRGRGGATSL
jgi:deoxyribonuclease-4